MATQGGCSTSFRCNFEVGVLDIVSREEYLRASKIFRNAIKALHNKYGVVVESGSPKPVEMPEPTGPVMLETSEAHTLRGLESLVGARLTRDEADAKIRDVQAQNPDPEVSKAVEDYVSRVVETRVVFVKPSEPAEPQEVVCVTPSIILAKESQVEDAKSIIQSEGSDTATEFVTPLQEPSQIEHDVGPEPEEPEPTESEKLATEFENRCFDEVTSPETAAKLWEEYKTRIASHGDAYRKQRATSLVMAVVDHNKEFSNRENVGARGSTPLCGSTLMSVSRRFQ